MLSQVSDDIIRVQIRLVFTGMPLSEDTDTYLWARKEIRLLLYLLENDWNFCKLSAEQSSKLFKTLYKYTQTLGLGNIVQALASDRQQDSKTSK